MGNGRSAVATPKREEPPKKGRWSARKKADAVVRLLRGESLDELSRELRVEAHRLQAWRDEFLAGGIEGLKARPLQPEDRRLRDAERKIGELTMDNEILRAAAQKRGFRSRPGSGRDSRGAGGREKAGLRRLGCAALDHLRARERGHPGPRRCRDRAPQTRSQNRSV